MYRDDIICALQQLPDVEIGETTDDYCVVYDNHTGKIFQYEFNMTAHKLASKIYVSANLPQNLQIDKFCLSKYLFDHVDSNAFLTLECLCFVFDEYDYKLMAAEFECCAPEDFHKQKELGIMWYDKNVCIVDVANIAARTKKHETNDVLYKTRREIIVTAIHELRHLMLDTNIVLSFDEYPLELGQEHLVEEYAQDVVDRSDDWIKVFKNQ